MNPPSQLNALPLVARLKRAPHEHKGDAGKVILIGGSPGMAGALLLAGKACMHLGAGWTLLQMLDPASSHADYDQAELMIQEAHLHPSEFLNISKPDVIAIGPGLGKSERAISWLAASLHHPNIPLVIDADALNLVSDSPILLNALQSRNQLFPDATVITPHPGEAGRLLNCSSEAVQKDRIGTLENLVALTRSIVVLKGQHTLIASPLHTPLECREGNPGMGTGGMGDILTGAIAALAAQGVRHSLNLWEACALAVQLHACAADNLVKQGVGPIGLTPNETILEMRKLLNQRH
jgi:hydroxyethylthiazole kinase-like uncharacterized protein yjeF